MSVDDIAGLQRAIEGAYAGNQPPAPEILEHFLALLDAGKVRAAEPTASGWQVNDWVKKGILLIFRSSELADFSESRYFRFFDKAALPLKPLTPEYGVRVVPGGTSIRRGSYLAPGVVIMPPAYINIGAYVGENSMIDSHALVGSCVQMGKAVHLSAGAQLGGVLEPVGSMPVIIEDHVIIGGNCGVFEGAIVGKNAVLGAGVILTRSTPVYDVVRERVYRATPEQPLRIPAGAVVVPGSRPMQGNFAEMHHLSLQTPIIVKYRDDSTDAATALEEALR